MARVSVAVIERLEGSRDAKRNAFREVREIYFTRWTFDEFDDNKINLCV